MATKTTLTREEILGWEGREGRREEGQASGWKKKATVEAGTRVGPSTWPESFVWALIGWIRSSTAGLAWWP